ncbi:response regulator transcription factor [Clostridium estertheticum]|uniref:Stage 0 sporulation protein A homolog n=1 Tax=Clostridium estertheticum TaxID=238834 RepID=A0A5N7IUV1_9CLOT|nr:LytTR family DNA-binding domain-containing protein [Clostridium estertheticum]MPQ34074.1 response regulator transcription factor [Clostridium estertheticum]MPQ64875.1 response regulator transcription factor [Clostridium estertheticum]
MMKIAICDDEKHICEQLENILEEISISCSCVYEIDVFYSGESLYQYMENGNLYDFIFLDIELKNINGVNGINGVEVGKKIRLKFGDENILIVYISAKENYAIQLFRIRPLDFIVKPITYSIVFEVIKMAYELINKNKSEFFQYQRGKRMYKVPVKDILYFESNNRKLNIITKNGSNDFYGTLSEVYKKINKYNFILIHKSYLINHRHAIEFEYNQITMANNKVLPISQTNRKEVREFILNYERRRITNELGSI